MVRDEDMMKRGCLAGFGGAVGVILAFVVVNVVLFILFCGGGLGLLVVAKNDTSNSVSPTAVSAVSNRSTDPFTAGDPAAYSLAETSAPTITLAQWKRLPRVHQFTHNGASLWGEFVTFKKNRVWVRDHDGELFSFSPNDIAAADRRWYRDALKQRRER